MFCDLELRDTRLDGTLRSKGTGEIDGNSIAWDVTTIFRELVFSSAGGSPVGGSIDVTVQLTIGGVSYAASGTVAF